MAVCKACGTENRNKAKFCRGCAAPLPPEAASTRGGALPEHICPTCKVRNPAKARFCQACGVPLVPPSVAYHPMPELPGSGTRQRAGVLLVGVVLVLASLGTWWKLSNTSDPASLAATPEATVPVAPANEPAPPAPVPAPEPAVPDLATASTAPGSEAHLSEAERLRLSLERLEREDQARSAALEQQRAAMAAEQRRRAEQARRRAEATAAAATSPMPAPAPSPQPATATPAEAKNETTPPPAASAATVELACAGSTNFFARDLCRIRECRKPSFARDPICVRFREMEEASRRKLAN